MAWLVLDTSNPVAVVGVVDVAGAEPRVLAEVALTETRKHAESLVDAVDRALAAAALAAAPINDAPPAQPLAGIDGVGVGVGPGSFIGVRTGIATAKGLCIGRGVPLVGLPSLVALASSAALPRGTGLAVVDAKRGEVYAQVVENIGAGAVVARAAACAMTPADAAARAADLAFVVGHELAAGVAHFVPQAHPSAAGLALVLKRVLDERRASGAPVDELRDLAPDYCRGADAKLPAVDPSARRNAAG